MKDNKHNSTDFPIEDDTQKATADTPQDGVQHKTEKLKKPLIFALMGVVFLGCMYLIFTPWSDEEGVGDIGLNLTVPQATGTGLEADKQKAYQQEILEENMQEKHDALFSLSDYWNTDSTTVQEEIVPDGDDKDDALHTHDPRSSNPALHSYRRAQHTLTSFYDNNDREVQNLRNQVEALKEQLIEKDIPPSTTVQDQLDVMEKSYEMASRYLPSNPSQSTSDTIISAKDAVQKDYFVAFTPVRKNPVSALYREPVDSIFLTYWNTTRGRGFHTVGTSQQTLQPKNSIRAVVQQTQSVTAQSDVRLRLLETAQTPSRTIPVGTLLTANAKFQNGRLHLKVTSVEAEGNIIPVDVTIYDLEGQQGLYIPYSPEMNALTEIASNMGQTSGTSIMMPSSAGQQIAGELSRGVLQGASGYFSKKMRTPKIILKAGHQVLLVSKK